MDRSDEKKSNYSKQDAKTVRLSKSQQEQLNREEEAWNHHSVELSEEAIAAAKFIGVTSDGDQLRLPEATPCTSKSITLFNYIDTTLPQLKREAGAFDVESLDILADLLGQTMPIIQKSEKLTEAQRLQLIDWANLTAGRLSRGEHPRRPLLEDVELSPHEASREETFKTFEYWLMKNALIRSEIFMNGDRLLYNQPYEATIKREPRSSFLSLCAKTIIITLGTAACALAAYFILD